jgi:hypothetical protein
MQEWKISLPLIQNSLIKTSLSPTLLMDKQRITELTLVGDPTRCQVTVNIEAAPAKRKQLFKELAEYQYYGHIKNRRHTVSQFFTIPIFQIILPSSELENFLRNINKHEDPACQIESSKIEQVAESIGNHIMKHLSDDIKKFEPKRCGPK